MKVLQESALSQTLTFIPRSHVALVNYTLTNESTNTSVSATDIVATTSGGYLVIDEIFTLLQGVFYNIEVTSGTTVIYRGRIFCTNQDIDTFTMNTDYVSKGKDNTYAII